MAKESLVPVERVERTILVMRGRRVILDSELAALYGVPVKRPNEQVKRNIGRFPDDFAFQLTKEEVEILKSQFATSRSAWGGSRKPPTAFTEHGAVMAASVLNSPKAVAMSVEVVRAFVLAKDPTAWAAIDIIGTHKYNSQKAEPRPSDVDGCKRSKPVYETEVSGVMYWPEQGPSSDINNGIAVAGWVHSAVTHP
jgi:hypothetical protein